jgi:hypothetical protein
MVKENSPLMAAFHIGHDEVTIPEDYINMNFELKIGKFTTSKLHKVHTDWVKYQHTSGQPSAELHTVFVAMSSWNDDSR